MKKIKIAVGTTSEQKIGYLKEILKELNIKSKLVPVEIETGISYQPLTSDETKRGSIKRAKNSLKKTKEADFSLGIEVGYRRNRVKKYEMFCWATIIDNHGHQISNQSHSFLLPKFHQSVLDKKMYLGDNLDGYYKNKKDLISRQIDDIIRHRKPFITNAIKGALIRYLKKEDF